MPPPNRRHDPSPEELARQIADQLARSKPTTPRVSFRHGVLAGRLIAGVTALASIALVVAGVVAGASWLLDRTMERHPEVLANTVEQNHAMRMSDDTTTTNADATLLPLVPLVFPTPLSDTVGSVDQPGPTAVTIPPATTTTTSTPTTSNPVVSTSMPTTTSVPGTGGSSSSTTATTTQPPTTTTLPATTTTTTSPPTTTTTEPTTTTTTPTSTTTEATTTTTTRPSPPSTPGRGG